MQYVTVYLKQSLDNIPDFVDGYFAFLFYYVNASTLYSEGVATANKIVRKDMWSVLDPKA